MIMERDPRQEWRTPHELFTKLHFEFEVDAAAAPKNALCPIWYGPGSSVMESAFDRPWLTGRSHWCNPGFSNMKPWVEASVRAARMSGCTVVLLGLVSPSTEWWTMAEERAAQIRLLSPRPQFLPADGLKASSNPRENALFIFTPTSARFPGWGAGARQWRWKA